MEVKDKRDLLQIRASQQSIHLDHDYCAVPPADDTKANTRENVKQPTDYYKVLRRKEIVWGQGIASKGIRCSEVETTKENTVIIKETFPNSKNLEGNVTKLEKLIDDTSIRIKDKSNIPITVDKLEVKQNAGRAQKLDVTLMKPIEDTSLSITKNCSVSPAPKFLIKKKALKTSKEGKLMVSVLKSKSSIIMNSVEKVTCNTVIPNDQKSNKKHELTFISDQIPKKRKLNLEEYKRLRDLNKTKSCEPSRTNSPNGNISPISSFSLPSTTVGSPQLQTNKKVEHNLIQMAAQVLLTRPSDSTSVCDVHLQPFVPPGTKESTIKIEPEIIKEGPEPEIPINRLQSNYEMKTFVSIGTNTDITVIQTTRLLNNQKQEKLKADKKIKEIITPILQNGVKINSNSLISNIKNTILHKKTVIKSPTIIPDVNSSITNADGEHGENKVVVHLEKNRPKPITVTLEIQTDPWEYEELNREKKGSDSYSSRRRNRQYRKRCESNSSCSSVETTFSRNSRGKSRYDKLNNIKF